MCTTQTLLELVGIPDNKRDILSCDQKIRDSVKNSILKMDFSNANQGLANLFDYLIREYSNSELYNAENLLKLLKNEMRYGTDYRNSIAAIYENNLNDKAAIESLYKRFAFNSIINFPYQELGLSKENLKKIDLSLLSTMRKMITEDYIGYSFASAGDRCLRLASELTGQKLEKIYEIGEMGVDAEIMHYALVGSHQGGQLNEVAVFTCEKLEKWKKRIHRYGGFLAYLLENANVCLYPGVIYFVNPSTGEIESYLNVYDELKSDPTCSFIFHQDRAI